MSKKREVGPLLRAWRERRRKSQLHLALETDISARHLSFLETGRARPSRDMLLRLAMSLEVSLRGQNELLLAAGFAPEFPERSLDHGALAQARRAIDLVVQGHQPYPAIAIDRHWTLLSANDAAMTFLEGIPPGLLAPPVNVLRISLHPEGMAPRIANLAQWREHILARLRRQIETTGDPVLVDLAAELVEYDSAPGAGGIEDGETNDFVVPLTLRTPAGALSFFSTTTVFGTPRDVTLSELAIESFYPADEETVSALGTRRAR